ncbi:unnamed protein product [Schistosoma curassoni]|uniref:Uncharacterized protein n=1 Tax=Schistosoma curassoni TaxID=6186 RepID=A0A183KEA2_9TREM|nr:unnamed protein product [Schistosoma curassoni]
MCDLFVCGFIYFFALNWSTNYSIDWFTIRKGTTSIENRQCNGRNRRKFIL